MSNRGSDSPDPPGRLFSRNGFQELLSCKAHCEKHFSLTRMQKNYRHPRAAGHPRVPPFLSVKCENAEGHFLIALSASVSLSDAQRYRLHPFSPEYCLWLVPSVIFILDLARHFRSASLRIASVPGVPVTGSSFSQLEPIFTTIANVGQL